MKDTLSPILMTEEFWINSQLSLVRYYGQCKAFGHRYVIAAKNDLVRDDFLPIYGKLKRDKFLSVLKDHPQASDKELKCIFKELTKKPEKKQEQTINFEQQ